MEILYKVAVPKSTPVAIQVYGSEPCVSDFAFERELTNSGHGDGSRSNSYCCRMKALSKMKWLSSMMSVCGEV